MNFLAYISGAGDTDADMIRHVFPVHVVPADWMSSYGNWLAAEMSARLALIFTLWYFGVAFVSRRYFKSRAVKPWVIAYSFAVASVF